LIREFPTTELTVHTYRPGVNVRAAPPALFAALAGFPAEEVRYLLKAPFPNKLDRTDGRFPQTFKSVLQGGDNPVYLVHAEALTASGQAGVKEAIVDIGPNARAAFALRELRSGATRHLDQLRAVASGGGKDPPNCEP
jgi:general secretion pathway protein K